MKYLPAIRWFILHSIAGLLAWFAVVENNIGATRCTLFLVWFSAVVSFTTLCVPSLTADARSRKRPVTLHFSVFFDFVLGLFFLYHGWWTSAVVQLIGFTCLAGIYYGSAADPELEALKKKYAEDVAELNARLINRREAYEEYYAKVKKPAV